MGSWRREDSQIHKAGCAALSRPTALRLGANARTFVREHFSLDRLGREINEIYGELVEKKLRGGTQADGKYPSNSRDDKNLDYISINDIFNYGLGSLINCQCQKEAQETSQER